MGRGTYHAARNHTMGYGTLQRGTEPYQRGEDQNIARSPIMMRGNLSRGGNPTMGRGPLPWVAEPYHGARNATMGRGTLPWGRNLMGAEHNHEAWNTTMVCGI